MRILRVPLDTETRDSAAWQWLLTTGLDVQQLSPDDLANADVSERDVIWLDAALPADAEPAWAEPLARRTAGWLLTGGAVTLPSRLGLEATPPGELVDRIWSDEEDELFLFRDFSETPRIRGHAAFRHHSLFDGLGSGVYTWWPRNGDLYRRFTYRLPDWPQLAGVVAVERAFIHIQHDHATIWEYADPRILCIGAYLPFESADPLFKPHLHRLALNAFRYLARSRRNAGGARATGSTRGRTPTPDRHWRPPSPHTLEDMSLEWPHAALATDATASAPLPLELASLKLDAAEPDEPFSLAGRRAFIAAKNQTCELWVHPLRVMTARVTPVPAEITSLGIAWRMPMGARVLAERIHVAGTVPAAVFEWSLEGPPNESDAGNAGFELRIDWTTDLRLMWPYPRGALGPLHWRTHRNGLLIRAPRTGETVAFIAQDPLARFEVRDASDAEAAALHCTLVSQVTQSRRLRLVVAAATSTADDLHVTLQSLRDANKAVRARAASLRRLENHLSLHSPDADANVAFQWACFRLDSFLAETPALGTSLLAGYSTSGPGWNEGRPGYAWYFGRDAVWTALASLAIGDFDAARNVLAFLAQHQDLNGKILHECTTSGSVHYDSADATPLFLLLVARYHAWSGDDAFVRDILHDVRSALQFCIETDTDLDGLVENTRVGHGWIEFGRLGGGRATFYNAGIWTAALRELIPVAQSLGEIALVSELEQHFHRASLSIESRFYSAEREMYALKIDPADFTPTATHAVPLLLGVANPQHAERWFAAAASAEMTTDWGVRMLPGTEPGFNPASYHGGAVWPLYTGWTSWAEYVAGRSQEAFRHWRMNLQLAFGNARGEWDEVLHGTEARSIGVCAGQAWSTAMAVAPLVYGLLGAEPDAPLGRLKLRPQIPADWDHLEIRGIRIGQARLNFRFRRTADRLIFRVEQDAGDVPIRLILEPAVSGTIRGARVDGSPATLNFRPFGDRWLAPVQLVLDHERQLELEIEP